MKRNLLLISLIFSMLALSAQQERHLPKWLTAREAPHIAEYALSRTDATDATTTPPPFSVRTAAEWEEIQTLCITWRSFPSILRQIVKEAQTECKVMIVCSDSVAVKNDLTSNGISLTNVQCLQTGSNTIWMRDYGGNTVYKNEVEDLLIVDWIYNRPRPLDDVVPESIASQMGIPVYATTSTPYDLVHTGGNFMSDGMGTAFSSKLVLNENKGTGYSLSYKSEAQIDTIMNLFMGIKHGKYIKMETLPYDGIHHIDMHMKLLDEQTLVMGEYPTGVSDGPQIEANLQYVLSNYTTSFGTPFKVVRIQMPPQNNKYPSQGGDYRTYTNCVFVNKKVLVPVYEEKFDTTALRILRENLPGYNVIGINCNSIIQQSGALHCITHSIGVNEPLLINHLPLSDTYNSTNPYTVNASIKHQSGIQSATLWYRVQPGSTFQSVAMLPLGNSEYTADIPAQAVGSTIEYYIGAQASSGKQQVRPITAPTGFFKFKVLNATNLAEGEHNEFLPLFPNPASAITCLPVSLASPQYGSLKIYDVMGRCVKNIYEGNMPAGTQNYFIHAETLTTGSYFVEFRTAKQVQIQKLLVK